VMRVVMLKVAGDGVARLIGYYAGLARDQLRRDGVARGPVERVSICSAMTSSTWWRSISATLPTPAAVTKSTGWPAASR
jgi:hypothetical protein